MGPLINDRSDAFQFNHSRLPLSSENIVAAHPDDAEHAEEVAARTPEQSEFVDTYNPRNIYSCYPAGFRRRLRAALDEQESPSEPDPDM